MYLSSEEAEEDNKLTVKASSGLSFSTTVDSHNMINLIVHNYINFYLLHHSDVTLLYDRFYNS